MKYIDERYRNDAEFHQLVDLLEAMIRQGRLSASETREAAMLAQMHYEMTTTQTVEFSPSLLKEIEFRAGGKFLKEEKPQRGWMGDINGPGSDPDTG